MRNLRIAVVLLAIVGMCSVAGAQDFMEDFESYAAGSEMHGQGGWSGWDNVAAAGAPASSTYAFSGSNSVEIIGAADLVHEYDLSGGRWILTAMQYCPSGTTGETYFILLNTYTSGGDPKDWSVQVNFNLATGLISFQDGGGATMATASILYDEWVELKFIIDLGGNVVDVFYAGEQAGSYVWDNNSHGTFQCIDLFGNNASSVYYDDIKVEAYIIYAASEPKPADGATGITAPLLEWTKGDTAMFHDVYLGTSPDLTEADKVSAGLPMTMYYHIWGYEPGVTYYWRVDEIEADGTVHTGDVWTFMAAPKTAYNPSPWNGAKGIDPEMTELGWSPGTTAMSHDVYLGTSKDDVANGTGDTFMGNQLGMIYSPGALEQDTTYYWRVDEVESGDTKQIGPVWSFKTIGPSDGVKAEYFGGMGVSGVPVLTQTENSINHNWGSGEIAAGLSDSISARWTAILEPPFTETYTLITTSDDGVRLWLDGRPIVDNWTDHGTTDNRATVDLIAGNLYLVVMEYYENGGGAVAQLSWESPSIARQIIPAGVLQLPLRAVSPYPAHTATDVPDDLTMHWTAGDEAAGHQVFFGDDAEAVADATMPVASKGLDELTHNPGALEWGKTYYWRIDEVNAASADGPWKGNVWSFTVADFIVIDDFEGYTDDVGFRIFQTWLDGLGYTEPQIVEGNGTGATVGYVEAPFAEQRIVHTGSQSMPMDYNNVISPYYSETERTWAVGQDFTRNGADTLVLYVRGKSNNGADSLYVAVQDTAGRVGVVSHADAAVVKATDWVEWQIPLSEFAPDGVNMTAVKKMYIGVGNRNAPTPGGAGTLYIDDVRVIQSVAAE